MRSPKSRHRAGYTAQVSAAGSSDTVLEDIRSTPRRRWPHRCFAGSEGQKDLALVVPSMTCSRSVWLIQVTVSPTITFSRPIGASVGEIDRAGCLRFLRGDGCIGSAPINAPPPLRRDEEKHLGILDKRVSGSLQRGPFCGISRPEPRADRRAFNRGEDRGKTGCSELGQGVELHHFLQQIRKYSAAQLMMSTDEGEGRRSVTLIKPPASPVTSDVGCTQISVSTPSAARPSPRKAPVSKQCSAVSMFPSSSHDHWTDNFTSSSPPTR